MMNAHADETFHRVRKLLISMVKMKEESIKETSNLQTDLGIDSLDVVEIVSRMEEEFGIQFESEDLPVVRTVSDVVQLVEKARRT